MPPARRDRALPPRDRTRTIGFACPSPSSRPGREQANKKSAAALLGGLCLPALAAFVKRPQAEAQIGADLKIDNTTANCQEVYILHVLSVIKVRPSRQRNKAPACACVLCESGQS